MGSFGFPGIVDFYDMIYGAGGYDFQAITVLQFGGASGIVFPGNPAFTVTDFIGIYPKFVGQPSNFSNLTITQGSNVISGFSATTGLAVGQLVVNIADSGNGPTIPKDSVITQVNSTSITISNPATTSASTLTVYCTPIVPIVVLLAYLMLAQASVMYSRYCEAWFMQMCYFIAHYATLWARTEAGVPNITAAQVASSGLTKGIIVQQAAGDVRARAQLIQGYEEWGAWAETQYGELFITVARATAMGPIWVP